MWTGHRVGTEMCYRNVQRFRGGLVFKAHRLCASLSSRLESNTEDEEGFDTAARAANVARVRVTAYIRQSGKILHI